MVLRHIQGHWQWSHISIQHGTRRAEREDWYFAAPSDNGNRDAREVRGIMHRTITVTSTDSVPFTCNQAHSYRLRSEFHFAGELIANARASAVAEHVRTGRGDLEHLDLSLHETSYTTAPSPCDSGQRRLGHYRVAIENYRLIVTWPGGRQILRRPIHDGDNANSATNPAAAVVAPPPPWRMPSRSLTGRWHWHTKRADRGRGLMRVEREQWTLNEGLGGQMNGTVLRTVTITAADTLACSGTRTYQYRDRYQLRGRRDGDRVTLSEIAVDPARHPCLPAEANARHLDSAHGIVVGEYLVLLWRGQRRQVLSRDH